LEELLTHEQDLLAAMLPGDDDHTARWGQFRRRIGLRYNEPVPVELWSSPALRMVAVEIDAIFRGQRDVHTINANAIRHDLRERSLSGRWEGSLQEMEVALADLLAWGRGASALDFPIACDIFQAAKARQIFYPAMQSLLDRRGRDRAIAAELQECRQALNAAQSIASGRFRQTHIVHSARRTAIESIRLAALPLEQRVKPVSTGIPSLDLDMRGGVVPGHGEGTWVLAARSGVGKTTLGIAAAMGLACNGASVLVFSCELTCKAILARILSHYCRRAMGSYSPLYSANDLEGRGRVLAGGELEQVLAWHEQLEAGLLPDGQPMGEILYESRFGATVEEFCELVEDTKAAHPALSLVVLDHFHAMGSSPGYGNQTTAELANRAMAIKALSGRCELDILVVAQLNRGAYGSTSGPDVSHLAGTSELERYASAVWLIDRPKTPDGAPPPKGVLEVHHGKFRHGQTNNADLTRTLIRLDRAHCYLESDEAKQAFGSHCYPLLS
jgi:replicative DNA helicase